MSCSTLFLNSSISTSSFSSVICYRLGMIIHIILSLFVSYGKYGNFVALIKLINDASSTYIYVYLNIVTIFCVVLSPGLLSGNT